MREKKQTYRAGQKIGEGDLVFIHEDKVYPVNRGKIVCPFCEKKFVDVLCREVDT